MLSILRTIRQSNTKTLSRQAIRSRRRLRLELLEIRKLLTVFTWDGNTADWNDSDEWSHSNPVDAPLGDAADPNYPTSDGLWDIARFTGNGTAHAVEGTSAGRIEATGGDATLDLSSEVLEDEELVRHAFDVQLGDPQHAIPDLQVSSKFTIANQDDEDATVIAPFVRIGSSAESGFLKVTGTTVAVETQDLEVVKGVDDLGTEDVVEFHSMRIENLGRVTVSGQNQAAAMSVGTSSTKAEVVVAGAVGAERSELSVTGRTIVGAGYGAVSLGEGKLTVTNGGVANLQQFDVGPASKATISLSDGGQLNTTASTVGKDTIISYWPEDSNRPEAVVEVTGSGSKWTVDGSLGVGHHGTIDLSGNGTLRVKGDLNNDGHLEIDSGAFVEARNNAGVKTTVSNSGVVSTTTTAKIIGNYTQLESGVLEVTGEFHDNQATPDTITHHYLEVEGTVHLGGTLKFTGSPSDLWGLDASDTNNYFIVLRSTEPFPTEDFDFVSAQEGEPTPQQFVIQRATVPGFDSEDNPVTWHELRLVAVLNFNEEPEEVQNPVPDVVPRWNYFATVSTELDAQLKPRLAVTYRVSKHQDDMSPIGATLQLPLVVYGSDFYNVGVGGDVLARTAVTVVLNATNNFHVQETLRFGWPDPANNNEYIPVDDVEKDYILKAILDPGKTTGFGGLESSGAGRLNDSIVSQFWARDSAGREILHIHGKDVTSEPDDISVTTVEAAIQEVHVRLHQGPDSFTAEGVFAGTSETKLWVFGGPQNDTVTGSEGIDHLYGGDAHDSLNGRAANDFVYGELGNDGAIEGTAGLQGGDGQDTIDGGEGDDKLYGDAGDDTLYGRYGTDTIDGGSSIVKNTVRFQGSDDGMYDELRSANSVYDNELLFDDDYNRFKLELAAGDLLSAHMHNAGRLTDDNSATLEKFGAGVFRIEGVSQVANPSEVTFANKEGTTEFHGNVGSEAAAATTASAAREKATWTVNVSAGGIDFYGYDAGAPTSYAPHNLKRLDLTSGTTAIAHKMDPASLTGLFEPQVLVLNELAIPTNAQMQPTAKLDLTINDMILRATFANRTADYGSAYNLVKSAFSDGEWVGVGITSSIAAERLDTGIAIGRNWLLGESNFAGEEVAANDILFKYTYYGDLDFNGQVDGDDLTTFSLNFGTPSGMAVEDGDINFDGKVDGDDLTVFGNNFNKGIGNPL